MKRTKPEKKQSSVSGCSATSDGCSVLQGSVSRTGLYQEADGVVIKGSDISLSVPLGAVRKVEGKPGGGFAADAGSSTPAESVEPQVNVTSAPTHSLLDLLADQALAREKPFSVSQELLAAAVAKYKRSVQHWSFVVDSKSPPLPPPPPQSSPVGFLVSGVCPDVPSKLLQIGDLTKHVDAGEVYVISDDDPDDPVP